MCTFFVNQADPEEAYDWLKYHLQQNGELFRIVPYDADGYVIQVGSHVLDFSTDEEAGEYFAQLEEDELGEKDGFLFQDWKGFDAIVLDFIQPHLQHSILTYQAKDDGSVVWMKILPLS